MKTIKTIIIDDERLAREELKLLLKDNLKIEIIDEAKNGKEGVEKCNNLKPDLIFLDISMPEMDGFEVLKKLEDIPHVIFITAYDEFAFKAFEVNALDYILKPIETVRLEEAISKTEAKDDFESDVKIYDRQSRLLKAEDHVFIKDGEKCFFIPLNKIRLFESDGNYVKVYFENKRPLILRSLNTLEEKLDPEVFFRANRKFIINTKKISHVENWFNGGLQVEMDGGEQKIEISRRQATKFKDFFSL
jgi:two-component system, LytTR family, response regulator